VDKYLCENAARVYEHNKLQYLIDNKSEQLFAEAKYQKGNYIVCVAAAIYIDESLLICLKYHPSGSRIVGRTKRGEYHYLQEVAGLHIDQPKPFLKENKHCINQSFTTELCTILLSIMDSDITSI
jgi:hypothetical protein